MGGSVGKVLKGTSSVLGPLASIAGPILAATGVGAPIGAAVSAGGRILQQLNNQQAQSAAQGAAGSATNTQQKVGDAQAEQYLHNQPGALKAIQTNSGFDPATGTWNPNYNPYGAAADSLAGALPGQAEKIFSPGALTGGLEAYKEGTDRQYDAGVDALKHDLSGSGFAGSSATDAGIASLRRGQAEGNADESRRLIDDLIGKRQDYVAGGTAASNNLRTAGTQQAQANLSNYEALLNNGASTGVGVLQGVNSQYQANANRIGSGNAADAGANASVGGSIGDILGKVFGKKTKITGINGPVSGGSGSLYDELLSRTG